ncbi:nucleotide-diphospho-sugar transferase [Mycena pura]|uniref:Nucleotide-diphospho-sugar transferase n=1 Tax=Mycena pura TaxID=153505 RepID=A0AAD6YP66_9AGAR|nr:nucleotide-diphospho-sugar transferase [Mycena pura]
MSLKAAYVTLLTKTSYLAGTLVLHEGLKDTRSKYPLVVMVTPELPRGCRDVLEKRGILIREIQFLQPEDGVHTLAADARFHDTWTKLRQVNASAFHVQGSCSPRVFELEEFERVVLLDSDMLVKENIDDLMEISLPPDGIAASHVCACNPRKFPHYPADWIPENCVYSAVPSPTALPPTPVDFPRPYSQLNSGTVVLRPSKELAKRLYHFLATDERISTFTFPDQDLLTTFFHGKWTALPWYYNALKTLRAGHTQLWDDDAVRCLHYILADKPWFGRSSKEYKVVNGWWWAQYDKLCEELRAQDVEGWKLVSSTVVR